MKYIARLLALTTLSAVLAACGEGDHPGRATADPRPDAARAVADSALRQRVRTPEQRGVQVFTQALPDSMVVCGRARAATTDAYAPYVAVIAFNGPAARIASFHLGSTGPEASRVFVEMVDRCFPGGGPASARAVARAVSPLPSNPVPEAPVAQAEAPAPVPASRVVTARTGANIRNTAHGGEVIRSLPAGGTLDVIGEGTGGWYQVGERGTAVGWVHGSVVDVSAPRLIQVTETR